MDVTSQSVNAVHVHVHCTCILACVNTKQYNVPPEPPPLCNGLPLDFSCLNVIVYMAMLVSTTPEDFSFLALPRAQLMCSTEGAGEEEV